jgi:hypothetical protein
MFLFAQLNREKRTVLHFSVCTCMVNIYALWLGYKFWVIIILYHTKLYKWYNSLETRSCTSSAYVISIFPPTDPTPRAAVHVQPRSPRSLDSALITTPSPSLPRHLPSPPPPLHVPQDGFFHLHPRRRRSPYPRRSCPRWEEESVPLAPLSVLPPSPAAAVPGVTGGSRPGTLTQPRRPCLSLNLVSIWILCTVAVLINFVMIMTVLAKTYNTKVAHNFTKFRLSIF